MAQYLILKSDGESDDPQLGLTSDDDYSGGVLGADTYQTAINTERQLSSVTWYDISTLYNNQSHPTSSEDFVRYFDDERSDVSFGGREQTWDQDLAWGETWNGTTYPKPSYLPGDGFSFRLVGEVYAPESGTYQFGVDGDDAVDAHVAGQRVAYWYGGHGPNNDLSVHTGSISLSQGWHRIVIRHEEGGGGEAMAVGWNKPSDSSYSVIPNSNYRSPDETRLDATVGSETETSPALASSTPAVSPSQTTATDISGDGTTATTADGVTYVPDITNLTSVAEALTGASGDTTLAEMSGSSAVAEAIVEALTAVQAVTVAPSLAQPSTAASVAAADASTATIETVATFSDSSVSSVASIPVANTDTATAGASVEIFAIATPPTVNAVGSNADGLTQTLVDALTESATTIPISPTMDIVISVMSSQLSLEGSFSDSLAASVGAQTSIKVAKTVARGDSRVGDGFAATDAGGSISPSSAETILSTGDAVSTATLAETLAQTSPFGSSSAAATSLADSPVGTANVAGGEATTSASADGAVRAVVADELGGTAQTSVTADALAGAAEALIEEGLADTQVEAAAMVSDVLTDNVRTSEYTTVEADGVVGDFDVIDRTGRPTAEAIVEAAIADAAATILGESSSAATPLAAAADAPATVRESDATSLATPAVSPTGLSTQPLVALAQFLFASLTGANETRAITETDVAVANPRNYVRVIY